MEKSKLSFLLDFLFKSILIFFISFIWLRLYIHNNTLIFILSGIITIFFSVIISLTIKKKRNKIKLTKQEENFKKETKHKLLFLNNNEILDYLLQKLIFGEMLLHLEINQKTPTLVFYNFSFNKTEIDFIINCLKSASNTNVTNILIISNEFDKNCSLIVKNIKNFNVNLLNFDDFYIFYAKENITQLESKIIYEEKSKYTFKELLNIAFNKKKTKSYVITGLIFLVSSLFLRYNIYYIVFTTLMFSFALFSHFNKPFNKKPN